jgi:hypothetical protein
MILLFWIGMTGLLTYREILPMMLAEVSPTYKIDLTDEIGAPLVGWSMLLKGERIGSATSSVHVKEDRTYEFRSNLRFENFMPFGKVLPVRLRNAANTYRVTEEGKLRSLATRFTVGLGEKAANAALEMEVAIEGEVVGTVLRPRMTLNGAPVKEIDLGEIIVSSNVVNPMNLVSRLRGLHDGQTWKVPLFDPLQGVKGQFLGKVADMTVPSLIAEVRLDMLMWDKNPVLCYKIEYSEPGKEVVARTWVRKRDGLVLQQEAAQHGLELTLQRIPS